MIVHYYQVALALYSPHDDGPKPISIHKALEGHPHEALQAFDPGVMALSYAWLGP